MKAEQLSDTVRAAVKRRSGGTCEVCGRNPVVHLHHRRPRKMGGSRDPLTNTAANILALCCGCHSVIESARLRARSFGWLIPDAIDDPAQMPALLWTDYGELWMQLDHRGGKRIVDLVEPFSFALADTKGRSHDDG